MIKLVGIDWIKWSNMKVKVKMLNIIVRVIRFFFISR